MFNSLIKDYNLHLADKVILTGMSAGGVATLLWTDYLKAKLPTNVVFAAAPDSGFAMDVFNYMYQN